MVKKAAKKATKVKSSVKTSTVKSSVKTSTKDVENGKVFSIITWIFLIVGIIWFFADEKMKKNKYAKFQLKQAIVLTVVAILASIVAAIINFIPFLGSLIYAAVQLAIIILWIIGLVHAIQGVEKELPFIGQFASYLKF